MVNQMVIEQMRERILEAKANGFDEAIFVGRNQGATIEFESNRIESGIYHAKDVDGFNRAEFEGLPVYLVNADNYFRVA
jgi:hypothetical protein